CILLSHKSSSPPTNRTAWRRFLPLSYRKTILSALMLKCIVPFFSFQMFHLFSSDGQAAKILSLHLIMQNTFCYRIQGIKINKVYFCVKSFYHCFNLSSSLIFRQFLYLVI